MIRKRYLHLTEEILKEKPNLRTYKAPSLDDRQEIVIEEVPKLGEKAALEAIKEWGQHKSRITHLIFCTTSGVHMPGTDYQLAKLLDLLPNVNRLMLYLQGCYGGGAVLRVGKDIAENNIGARVLVVCAEITVMKFHAPDEDQLGSLVGQSLFGDGAGAVIIGADPDLSIERPIFQLACAKQRTIPNSEHYAEGFLCEMGLFIHLSEEVSDVISSHIETSLVEVFSSIGIDVKDWNSLFWVVHAGGRAILDRIQEKLAIKEDKLDVTRHVLAEYGNVTSGCVLFVLDEMRKKSLKDGKKTTGDGLDWGVLLGFGPGLTVETIALHSFQIDDAK